MVQVHNLQVNSRTTPTPPPRALDFFCVHFNHHQNNKHRALQCGLNNGKNSAKVLTYFFYQSSGFLRQHYIWDYVICIYKTFLKLNLFLLKFSPLYNFWKKNMQSCLEGSWNWESIDTYLFYVETIHLDKKHEPFWYIRPTRQMESNSAQWWKIRFKFTFYYQCNQS